MPRPTARTGLRRLLTLVRDVDDRTLDWVSTTRHGPIGRALGVVARATDLLGPVVAVSGWFMARGSPGERAAITRGWRALAVTAATESLVVKPLASRGRPDAARLPAAQRRTASPSTSAFPSGHLGAVTAFSVAAGDGIHRLRPWLAASTVAAAYSRVYTGRHYLSDVLVGTGLGVVAGALASRTSSSV